MTHGTAAAIGDYTTHGTTEACTDTITIHIMPVGTEDGILTIISVISTDRILDTTIRQDLLLTTISRHRDIRPDRAEYSPAAVHRSEEAQA